MNAQECKQVIMDKISRFYQSKDAVKFAQKLSDLNLIENSFDMQSLKDLDSENENLASGLHFKPHNALNDNDKKIIETIAKDLMPWRKGPFKIDELFIDTEWRSFIKLNLLLPHLNLCDKEVLDMGANNGYYLFELAKKLDCAPQKIVAFDPSVLYMAQFGFINFFARSKIKYFPLGIEDLRDYCTGFEQLFDTILCLGVLYHRHNPIECLKTLAFGLKQGGELILDCLIIESQEEIALCPKTSYASMKNVYFIPSLPTLQGWAGRAGFKDFEVLAIKPTTIEEQRKTAWIDSLSLDSFLDSENNTIEGYAPPIRGYFKLKKG